MAPGLSSELPAEESVESDDALRFVAFGDAACELLAGDDPGSAPEPAESFPVRPEADVVLTVRAECGGGTVGSSTSMFRFSNIL
jgi:hypothetical protein